LKLALMPLARAARLLDRGLTISVAIGGIADMTGNAAGSTRSRMTLAV
jgi:hypothetical protein